MPRPTGELLWQRIATSKKPNQPLPGACKRRARKGRSCVRGSCRRLRCWRRDSSACGACPAASANICRACCARRFTFDHASVFETRRMMIGAGAASREGLYALLPILAFTGAAALLCADGAGRLAAVGQRPRAQVQPAQSDRRPRQDILDQRADPARHVAREDARGGLHRRLGDLESPRGDPRARHPAVAARARQHRASDRGLLRHDGGGHVRRGGARCAVSTLAVPQETAHDEGRSEARTPRKRRRSARQRPDSPATARHCPPPHDDRTCRRPTWW